VFLEDFRRLFLKGLAALLPTVVTFAILVWAFNWINERVALPITDTIISYLPDPWEWEYVPNVDIDDALKYGTTVEEFDPVTGRQLTIEAKLIRHRANESLDADIARDAQLRAVEAAWHITFRKYKLNVIGFVIAVLLIYMVGFLMSGLLGRTAWRIVEATMQRIPLIRSVYPNIKQVTDFLFNERKLDFTGVVAVEYPRKGVWSLGLVTGAAMNTIGAKVVEEMITIFIPSSPTPVTGYTITVQKSDTIELALTIDEALRFTISGGVIKPPSEGGKLDTAFTADQPQLGAGEDEADGSA
jgi:uncharacterized membrane protein